jgi:hypothetical protein
MGSRQGWQRGGPHARRARDLARDRKPTSGTVVPTRARSTAAHRDRKGSLVHGGSSWRETVARYQSCPFRRVGSCTRLYAGAPGLGPVLCLTSFQDLFAVRARLAGPKSVINNGTNRIREFLTGLTLSAVTFLRKVPRAPGLVHPRSLASLTSGLAHLLRFVLVPR